MTKGYPRGTNAGDPQVLPMVSDTIKVRDLVVTVDGATGEGWGTSVVTGLPQGNLMLFGAVSYLQFTGPTSVNLDDDWEGDYGLGTTPADDATITAGDVDIAPSTAIAAATLEASPITRANQPDGSICGVVHDNTAGTLELNLNLLIDDANIGADGIDVTVNGEVYLAYAMLGDD